MNEKNIFGMLNADGSIASWPEADLNGRAVVRENATRAQVDSTRFVVMPINVEFTEELKAALKSGYDGLMEWRNKTVLLPPIGFTVMDDKVVAQPVSTFSVPSPAPLNVPPPVESFGKKKGGSDDNS